MKVIPKIALQRIKQLEDEIKKINAPKDAIKITNKTKSKILIDTPILKQELIIEEGKLYLSEVGEKHFTTDKNNEVDQTFTTKIGLNIGDYLVKIEGSYQLNNYDMEEVK